MNLKHVREILQRPLRLKHYVYLALAFLLTGLVASQIQFPHPNGSISTEQMSRHILKVIDSHREAGKLNVLPRDATAFESWLRSVGYVQPGQKVVDGWGNPFVFVPDAQALKGFYFYSRGPNGKDEKGQGDDYAYDPTTRPPLGWSHEDNGV